MYYYCFRGNCRRVVMLTCAACALSMCDWMQAGWSALSPLINMMYFVWDYVFLHCAFFISPILSLTLIPPEYAIYKYCVEIC